MTATSTAPRVVDHPDPAARVAKGRAARAAVPRASHEGWAPPSDRRSPVEVLQEQATTRVPELIPIRHARMTASPFAFYRGAAAVMAADLSTTPDSGLRAQICGDAHLANFGGFAAPDRTIVFDVNDFDETLPGPWEWDVKRLAASFEIAARAREFDDKTRKRIVRRVVRSYREAMRELAATRTLDLWYTRIDEHDVFDHFHGQLPVEVMKRFERNLAKARGKDSVKAFAKLTGQVDGEIRIVSDPPLIVRVEELMPDVAAQQLRDFLRGGFREYRQSLQPDRRHLLEQFELVDVARKVVGVGSVGTRCWVVLMLGRDESDPLFLQIKEAEASVLEPYVGKSAYTNHGRRVVEGQRFMQSSSDIFLGWDRFHHPDGSEHDFYVRQMWDGKFSPQIEIMEPEVLGIFSQMCGTTLARAHARSGDRVAIASYLGAGDVFDRAVATFADAYADQNERDYDEVKAAVASGVLEAHEDLPG
jgi:uncharacterized protein (DUF2252 family)